MPNLVPCLPFKEDGSINRTVPAAVRQQFALVGDAGKIGGGAHENSTVPLGSSDRGDGSETSVGNKQQTRAVAGVARADQPPPSSGKQAWELPKRHSLETLRERGFGSASGGIIPVGSATTVVDDAVIITKLNTSLRRAQEENARERERRQEYEDEARMAYLSLEAETKR